MKEFSSMTERDYGTLEIYTKNRIEEFSEEEFELGALLAKYNTKERDIHPLKPF